MYIVKCWIQTLSFSWPHFSEVKNLLLMTQFVLSYTMYQTLSPLNWDIITFCCYVEVTGMTKGNFNIAAELWLIQLLAIIQNFIGFITLGHEHSYVQNLEASFKDWKHVSHTGACLCVKEYATYFIYKKCAPSLKIKNFLVKWHKWLRYLWK